MCKHLLALGVATILLAGCSAPSAQLAETPAPAAASASPTGTPTPTPTRPTADVAPVDGDSILTFDGDPNAPKHQPEFGTTALALLDTLEIKGRAPKTGYERDVFGQPWLDVDRNGCDTRNDMLNRDLTDIVHTNSVPCKVQSGVLDDPYTGTTIPFLRGQDTSIDVQIDHVVALSDAWQKGAQQLTFEQRVAFANDPLNLQSTDGPTNVRKGAGDAATWLPPNTSYRCEYVARQISVKATYTLWVTQAERDAMARILGNCADTMAPTNERAQEPEPVEVDAYPNCAAAIAAGAANIAVGQPGYGPHLDMDGNGVACEVSGSVGGQPAASAPAPAAPAAPAPAAPPAGNVYYQNCDAVRAAGAAPIYPGDPGFQPKFDRNNDGVGCE